MKMVKFIVTGIVFITLALFHQLNRLLRTLSIHAINVSVKTYMIILLQEYD